MLACTQRTKSRTFTFVESNKNPIIDACITMVDSDTAQLVVGLQEENFPFKYKQIDYNLADDSHFLPFDGLRYLVLIK